MSRSKFKQQKICKDKYAIYVLLCFFCENVFASFLSYFFFGGGGPIAIKIKMTSLNMTIIIVMKRRFNFQKNVQLKLILYDIRKAVPKVIETLKYKKF